MDREGKQGSENISKDAQETEDGDQNTSMAALIFWNISKAMESNPYINLKESLRAVQKNLQSNEYDVNTIISQQPVERHLACAYLAWQQIGHSNADSLYNLILSRTANECCTSKDLDKDFEQNKGTEKAKVSFISKDVAAEKKESHFSRKDIPKCENNTCVGPVVKLPVDAKIVMRVDGSLIGNCCAKKASNKESSTSSKQPKINEDLQAKIDQACCLDLACNSRLSALDQSTKELRTRAAKLAQREAERVELLERAEGAWRQLEVGYQRRLRVALEKEQDATRQIKKLICDRNCFKETTMVLVAQIKDYAIKVDVSRKSLEDVEKTFCAVGLDRLKYNDESTKVDTMLAEEQCKASQLDRDLLFKEEQARRRVLQLESELDSRRALLCEAQRAMRAELNGLRDQLKNVSKEFNDAEADIERIKKELDDLRVEKSELAEDLEGCLAKCDLNMKKRIDTLKRKTEELSKLKEKVLECKCIVPVDAPVQVKRTPSFAALCQCRPEENFLDSCSCTSLRTTLLLNMLADLFGGLQSELEFTGSTMPCQLLKCLEDGHNWDSSSIVKTNLRNFFSKLLIAELDIAIATAIENYHARWVGASCADVVARSIPDLGDESYNWQQKAIERRALTLANEMAEQMVQSRAEELLRHTKEVLKTSEPPPCECKPPPNSAVFTCITGQQKMVTGVNTNPLVPSEDMTTVVTGNHASKKCAASGSVSMAYWERAIRNVGQLKAEIEDLRKDTIKKQDLKKMEENIAKLVQRASGPDEPERILINKGKSVNDNGKTKYNPNDRLKRDKVKDEDKVKVLVNDRIKRDSFGKVVKPNIKAPFNFNRKTTANNSPLHTHVPKINKFIANPRSSVDKPSPKTNKKPDLHTYAVNYCMCGSSKGKRNTLNNKEMMDTYIKSSNEILLEANQSSTRRSKPILSLPSPDSFQQNNDKAKNKPSGGSNCVCLNKVPSSKSIDKLLETLMKWNCDLSTSNYECTQINCPYGLDSIINLKSSNNNALIQELVNSMSNAIKSRSMLPIVPPVALETPSQKKYIPSTPITLVSGSISQPTEGNINLYTHPLTITNTESEYMGAINLEKSNEKNCKCTVRAGKTTVDMDMNTDICSIQDRESFRRQRNQSTNAVFSTTQPYHDASERKGNKYSNASLSCESRVLRKPDDRPMKGKELYYKPSQIHNRASQVDSSVRLLLDNLEEIVKDKANIVEDNTILKKTSNFIEDNSRKLENTSNVIEDKSKMVKDRSIDCHLDHTNMDQIITSSLVHPCDCDYDVKFLGVTLRDLNDNRKKNKIIGNEQKQQGNLEKLSHVFNKKDTNRHQIQEYSNMDFSQYCNVTSKLSLSKLVDNWQCNGDNYLHEPTRICNMNINAFKELITNLKKHDSNLDKGLDTKSLAGTLLSKQSACVCCLKDKEEAQNLEVNTFYLLKEHLKQKWDEFRENCQSACIPPEEENKAFSLLLEKIKETISETADQAVCKCAEDGPTDNTWKRAYSLLQEYLKNKISRVHCKCSYPVEYNECLVPDVSAKVCNLIEKDFQRLKSLCKCLKKSITNKDGLDLTCSFQLPEKDINSSGKISKQVSNTSIIITQTASAQVQPNLVMESKSCEVIQKELKPENEIEIVHLSSGSKMHIPKTAEFIVSQCHNSTIDKRSSHELKRIAPIPSLDINKLEIMKDEDTYNKETPLPVIKVEESQNKNNPLSLPLIGYTVDCTCDKYLGPCVCSKATVQKNNRQIEEIWYNILSTSNKNVNDKSISYVMDNVKSTTSKSVDKICLQETPRDICIHHLINIDNVQQVNRDVMDNKTSVENMYVDLTLEYCSDKIPSPTTHNVTNTDVTSNSESDNFADSSFNEWFEYVPHTILDTPKSRPGRVPGRQCVTRRKSETQADNSSKPYLQNCDCSTVPICHVKMLVKNIERKLMLSDCTCDSMNSKVCPIHSRKNL